MTENEIDVRTESVSRAVFGYLVEVALMPFSVSLKVFIEFTSGYSLVAGIAWLLICFGTAIVSRNLFGDIVGSAVSVLFLVVVVGRGFMVGPFSNNGEQ